MDASRRFWTGIARAAAGALIFSLPMLMTMEMWWLGFMMDRLHLAILLATMIPVLTGLSHFVGFEPTFCWQDDLRDAFVALAVGFAMAALILPLLGVIAPSDPLRETVGKVALQAVPASFGAILARTQFAKSDEEERKKAEVGLFGEMFLLAAGALYLGFNLAPTEEMVLISYMITPWQAIALAVLSLILLHAIVYLIEVKGGHPRAEPGARISMFLRFSVLGYGVALTISLGVLWLFERTEDVALPQVAMSAIVLAFPASIGGAAARVII